MVSGADFRDGLICFFFLESPLEGGGVLSDSYLDGGTSPWLVRRAFVCVCVCVTVAVRGWVFSIITMCFVMMIFCVVCLAGVIFAKFF